MRSEAKKILVSKGLEPSLNFGKSVFRNARYSVYIASNGRKAMEIFEKIRPDLLLIDQNMEGITGDQLCKTIKSIDTWKKTPVILISTPSGRTVCREALCDGILTKPFTETELFSMLKKFMKLRNRKHERIPLSVKVTVKWKNKSFTSFSKDISEDGMFIKTHEEIPIGEKVALRLNFFDVPQEEDRKLSARVVRTISPESDGYLIPGIGVQFLETEVRERRKIRDYLAFKRAATYPRSQNAFKKATTAAEK